MLSDRTQVRAALPQSADLRHVRQRLRNRCWGQLQDHLRHRGACGDREDPHPPGPARQGPAARAPSGSICLKPPDPQADRICNKADDPAWPTLARRGQIASKRGDSDRLRGEWHRERGIVTKHRAIHRCSGRRCPSGSGKRWFKKTIQIIEKKQGAIHAGLRHPDAVGEALGRCPGKAGRKTEWDKEYE